MPGGFPACRVGRRWLTALCSVSLLVVLFWASSEDIRLGETIQGAALDNIIHATSSRISSNNNNNNNTITSRNYGSDNSRNTRDSGYRVRQLAYISSNISQAGFLDSQPQTGQGHDLGQGHGTFQGHDSGQGHEAFQGHDSGQGHGLGPSQDHGPGQGQVTRRRARVLLTSYMRSGSTFTGDIFQSDPGVFYLYEPLLYVNDDDYMEARQRPARSRLIPQAMGIPDPPEVHNYTLDLLNCQLTDHNLRFLYGGRFSKATADFDGCKKNLGPKPSAFGECGTRLRERCERSQAVVTKILRLKLWELDALLAEDGDLRVIHLVRDPRGVAVSRQAVRYYFIAPAFCARLNADAEMSARLQVKYPGRILTTRYEDLAMDAPGITKILFEFAGIPWSKTVEERLSQMTANSDTQTQEHVFNTSRKNSTLTAFSWRKKISLQTATQLQSACRQSMEAYGYLAFDSAEQLQDLNVPSITRDYSDKFFKAQAPR